MIFGFAKQEVSKIQILLGITLVNFQGLVTGSLQTSGLKFMLLIIMFLATHRLKLYYGKLMLQTDLCRLILFVNVEKSNVVQSIQACSIL